MDSKNETIAVILLCQTLHNPSSRRLSSRSAAPISGTYCSQGEDITLTAIGARLKGRTVLSLFNCFDFQHICLYCKALLHQGTAVVRRQ